MDGELDSLEHKISQLAQLAQHLRAENIKLRQEVASARSQQRKTQDKIDTATQRLEQLLSQLPGDAK